MNTRLDRKTIVVTGAAGGIGRATAQVLVEEGANIMLVDRAGTALKMLHSELEAVAGEGRVESCEADVTSESDVSSYIDHTLRRYGRLDGLFNNAGIEGPTLAIHHIEAADFDAVMAVNVRGVWLGMKYAIPAMIKSGGGSIVNTASGAAIKGLRGLGSYTASKHAVLGLSRVAALELAESGIRVNAICPGPVDTRMMEALELSLEPDDPGKARRLYEDSIPMKRYATSIEIARFVVFLLSDASPYITGSALSIDGGASA